MIGITETKIKSGSLPIHDITLENYKPESTPTEAEKGGTIIYISNAINYKRRPDLEIYVPKSIETTFIELIYPCQKNKIVGCIYKHHNITETELVELMRPTVKQITKEKKPCQLMGDFNINLLSSVQNTDGAEFFNEMTSFNFMPLITAPTRVTSRSKSLIDNIFVNRYDHNIISGNILVGISDHMPQFALIPEVKKPTNKTFVTFKRNFRKVNIENLNRDIQNIVWRNTNYDAHQFSQFYLGSIDRIVDLHAPLRKCSTKQRNLEAKPWITKGIQKSLSRKDKLYKKMMKEKDLTLKIQFEKDYKQLKQKIFNLTRSSKRLHYKNFFQENANNIRKLWAGVNEIIHCRSKKKEPINLIIDSNGNAVTQDDKIAKEFNEFFSGVADNILKKRKYPGNKPFTYYLKNRNENTIFLSPTDADEVKAIIALLSTSKSNGPGSIPNEILKDISYTIAEPISHLCNLIFTSGNYPLMLKIAKVIPIYKKRLKNQSLKLQTYISFIQCEQNHRKTST